MTEVNSVTKFFIPYRKGDSAWGDYGTILIHGIAQRSERSVKLWRSGPYVPPLTAPGSETLLLTEAAKARIVAARFSGTGDFVLVTKERITDVPWQTWDRTRKLPFELIPEGGEPESFVLDYPHSDAASQVIGDLWSWEPVRVGSIDRSGEGVGVVRGIREARLDVCRLNDSLFSPILMTEPVKKLIEEIAGQCIRFVEYGKLR